MKKADIFSVLFLLTIMTVRVGVFLFPLRKLMIGGMVIHHFWIGVVLVALAVVFRPRWPLPRMLLAAVGFGLVADELVYMVLGDGPVSRYWSPYSLIGAVLVASLVLKKRSTLLTTVL